MVELAVSVGGRSIQVRDAGDPDGVPVVCFHGTPGSRLETDFGADAARRLGIRLISFDRPGYGLSTAGPVTLSSVARDVEAVVDELGVDRFAAFGWSGGGPFALATAATLPDRVTDVGISGGPAPALERPGARDALDENDLLALSFLPDRPERAANQFLTGNRELLDAMISVMDDEQAPWIDWMWGSSDPLVVADPGSRRAVHRSFREALSQGPAAIAWDNVAFIGPWGVDLDDVSCPVHLWYGDRDQMVDRVNGEWLRQRLAHADLTVFAGEGHLLPLRHWDEMLRALIRVPGRSADPGR